MADIYDGGMRWTHFRITDPLWGESTDDLWIFLTMWRFDRFFAASYGKLLNMQPSCRRFETP